MIISDRGDPAFVKGELIERGALTVPHSNTQAVFCGLAYPWRKDGRLFTYPSLTIQTAPMHYRAVDIAVFRSQPSSVVEPPLIAMEIVSDDRQSALVSQLAEYEAMGVPNVWLAVPGLGTLSVFKRGSLLRTEAFTLPEFGLRFTAAQLYAA